MVYVQSVLEADTHKILWDFKIPTNPLFPARRPDLAIVNKKKSAIYWILTVVAEWKMKDTEKIVKYLNFTRNQKEKKD